MLTAVSRPHPGNDCVINPEPFFKLLLTAVGENGTQTVAAHLSPERRRGGFDPGRLSVTVRGRERMEGDHVPIQTRPRWSLCDQHVGRYLISCCVNKEFTSHQNDPSCYILKEQLNCLVGTREAPETREQLKGCPPSSVMC